MDTNEIYYRRYLVDPTNINSAQTPQYGEITEPDPNEEYYRRYLVDPLKVG